MPQTGRQGGAPGPGRQGGGPGGRQGAPARPPRDRAQVEGTAILRGRVSFADTGAPVRRAEVHAVLSVGPRQHVALTDTDGRFELRDLPAGSWTLRASKTGLVTTQYGQRAPTGPGESITLADGQQFTADFALIRGGVITGRVFDDGGDPIANVRVSAMRTQLTPNGRRMVGAGGGPGMTDDTGAFRLYGLPPGDYYISATPQTVNLSAAVLTAQGALTYAPTYFPGTIESSAAQRISLGAGQEQHNISFALSSTLALRVSGIVVNANSVPIQGMLDLRGAGADSLPVRENRVGTSADGTFTLPAVPPGNYVLEFTGRITSPDVPPQVAAVPISVGGGDLTGLTIITSHGATINGTVVADGGARLETAGIRATAPPSGRAGFTPRAQVTADGSFDLEGLIGPHSLQFERLPSGWIVKSITANGVDVTDVALDFRGNEQVSVRVLLTDRVTGITGTVRGETSPRGSGILVFPDDRSKWTPTSRYLRTARAGEKGQFTLTALPGNERYLAVALDYLEPGEHLDPEFLERLKPLATGFSLSDGEQKQVELTLKPRP